MFYSTVFQRFIIKKGIQARLQIRIVLVKETSCHKPSTHEVGTISMTLRSKKLLVILLQLTKVPSIMNENIFFSTCKKNFIRKNELFSGARECNFFLMNFNIRFLSVKKLFDVRHWSISFWLYALMS